MYHAQYQLSQSLKQPLYYLLVALTIVATYLLTGCAIGQTPTMSATDTASAYYQAIENKDYAKAYTYLSPYYPLGAHEALSRAGFISASLATDTAAGPVTSYTQLGNAANNGVVIVIISVIRRGQSYSVQLQLQQNKGTWQITYEDCSQFDCPFP